VYLSIISHVTDVLYVIFVIAADLARQCVDNETVDSYHISPSFVLPGFCSWGGRV